MFSCLVKRSIISFSSFHFKNSIFLQFCYFQAQENVDACCQRWFYSGKLLGDKILVEDAQIQPGYIVQVIVNTEHYSHGVNS